MNLKQSGMYIFKRLKYHATIYGSAHDETTLPIFTTETLVSGKTMSLLRAITDLATMETEERNDPSQTVDEPRSDGAADCGDNARRLAAML